MTDKAKDLCPHCGASMMVNFYTMNRALVGALSKMVENPGVPIKELGMNKSEYANYTKLKHWGLIRKKEDGLWIPLPLASRFLSNKEPVANEVGYFRDAVTVRRGEVLASQVGRSKESKQKYRDCTEPYADHRR